MKNTFLTFNPGGSLSVAPATAGSPDFNVTISVATRSETFSVPYDTNVAKTIDNFIAAHARDIDNKFGIACIDGATTLDLWSLGNAQITSTNAIVDSKSFTDADFQVNQDAIKQVVDTSAVALKLNLDAAAVPAASDVFTLTFVSEARKEQFKDVTLTRAASQSNGAFIVDIGHKLATS